MAPGPLETLPVGGGSTNVVVPKYAELRGVYKELAPTKFDVDVETGKKELEGFQAAKVSTLPFSPLPNLLQTTDTTPTSSTPTTSPHGTPSKSTRPSSPLSTSSTARTPTRRTQISSPPARP